MGCDGINLTQHFAQEGPASAQILVWTSSRPSLCNLRGIDIDHHLVRGAGELSGA